MGSEITSIKLPFNIEDTILPSGLSRRYAPPPVGAEILARIGVGMGVIVCVGVKDGVGEMAGLGVPVGRGSGIAVSVGGVETVVEVGIWVAITAGADRVGVTTKTRFCEP